MLSYYVLPLLSDISELSSNALAALQEFYKERESQEQRFEELKAAAEVSNKDVRYSMQMFAEDWNASQFWVG